MLKPKVRTAPPLKVCKCQAQTQWENMALVTFPHWNGTGPQGLRPEVGVTARRPNDKLETRRDGRLPHLISTNTLEMKTESTLTWHTYGKLPLGLYMPMLGREHRPITASFNICGNILLSSSRSMYLYSCLCLLFVFGVLHQ